MSRVVERTAAFELRGRQLELFIFRLQFFSQPGVNRLSGVNGNWEQEEKRAHGGPEVRTERGGTAPSDISYLGGHDMHGASCRGFSRPRFER